MKCQKCSKAATMHITEVLGEEQFEEYHLCEECAQKYLYEPNPKSAKSPLGAGGEELEESGAGLMGRECPVCGKRVSATKSGYLVMHRARRAP